MSDENHCKDCCCARSWEALGITEYTGLSIPEHVTKLREALDDICAHNFTYFGKEADHSNPASLYNRVNRGRALLLKLAGAATGRRES